MYMLVSHANLPIGGQIGHRKYDCPEQHNFTANIICRVCGNAGHMARDCPDRQRGTDWRNDGFDAARPIGSGDAVDREMEQLMQELSGGAVNADGHAPRRIEGGSAGDVAPWSRPPPPPSNDVAPWQQRSYQPRGDAAEPPPWASQNRGRDNNNQAYASNAAGFAGFAPWHQQQVQMPQAPGAPQLGYGYAGYAPYMPSAESLSAYAAQLQATGMGMPPGTAASTNYAAPPPPPPPPADGPPPPVCKPIQPWNERMNKLTD